MKSWLFVVTLTITTAIVTSSLAQEEPVLPKPMELEEVVATEESAMILEAVDEVASDVEVMVEGGVPEEVFAEENSEVSEQQLLPPALIEGGMMSPENRAVPALSEETDQEAFADEAELEPVAEEGEILPEDDLETELIELEMDAQLDDSMEQVETEARDLITISLDDVPVRDVVRMFTRISGVNIVAGTNLQGNVTVSLQEVEWEPALRVILDSVDMAMVEKSSDIYSIMSKSDMASEPVTVDTIFLSFTTVSNVLPVARRMIISTNGSASGYSAANAIIVQETVDQLNRIRATIAQLDIPRKQVFIEAKFVELNDKAIKDMGVNWQVLQNYTLSAGSMGYSYGQTRTASRGTIAESGRSWSDNYISSDSDVDTITDYENRQNGSGTVSGQWDAFSLVNGIPSLSYQESEFSGSVVGNNIDSIDGGGGTIGTVPVYERERVQTLSSISTLQSSESMSRNVLDDVMTVTEEAFGAVLSADDFALTLSALKQNSGVHVVSNPRLIVASGEKANIHVGIREPNIQAKPQGDVGNVYVYGLDGTTPFHEVGVKVDVLPTVNTDDRITLRIEPELSRLLGEAKVPIAGISFPRISTRTLRTEFNLESGRTVAIAGLTTSSDKEVITKVPLLGDIPVIGKYLFRHTHTEMEQDELIIFVTVGLASAETLTEVAGIPSGGKLIHRHLAKEAMQAQRVETTP